MSDLAKLNARYDLVVIGGGVHGAAVALEATRRGRAVLLVERDDFGAGTSANSLRILHGGLRYLQSADIRRSRESAREQQYLLAAAPHLVRHLSCMIGTGRSLGRGRLAMALGLWLYHNVVCMGLPARGRGKLLSVDDAAGLAGWDVFQGHTGAALWREAQVVDSERLVLTYLKTAENAGAHIVNHVAATRVDGDGAGRSVQLEDAFTSNVRRVKADVVIDTASLLMPHPHWTRGVNIVLNRPFPDLAIGLKLDKAGPDAGRLFFATPLHDKTIIGTWYFHGDGAPDRVTDIELQKCLADARALLPGLDIRERDLSLVHVGRLPVSDRKDPLSLLERPVIRPVAGDTRVISVSGVKFTTARPTARKALRRAGLADGDVSEEPATWYGAGDPARALDQNGPGVGVDEAVGRRLAAHYGSVADEIIKRARELPDGLERIPGRDAIRAEIVYCVDHEHCRTLADFVLRRSGLGSLGRPPEAATAYCAAVMAGLLGWDGHRVEREIAALNARYPRIDAHS